MPAELLTLPVASDYNVPVRWYNADKGGAVILLMPALGIPAGYYDPLASALQAAGTSVLIMEQRGHGESALRPSRNVDFGYREVLNEDIPTLLDWLHSRQPGQPVVLMGHSLGGHYASMTAGRKPERISGVILSACGTAYYEAFTGTVRNQLRVLITMIPLLIRAFGFYPGDKVGFGGREARRLMQDWLQLARHNRYAAIGLDEDLEAGIRRFNKPLLMLRMADDDYAPKAAMDAMRARYSSAQVSEHVFDAATLGDRADHLRWVRKPQAVTNEIREWLTSHNWQ